MGEGFLSLQCVEGLVPLWPHPLDAVADPVKLGVPSELLQKTVHLEPRSCCRTLCARAFACVRVDVVCELQDKVHCGLQAKYSGASLFKPLKPRAIGCIITRFHCKSYYV